MGDRENDIQELCKQILEMPVDFYYYENAPCGNCCPFCSANEKKVRHKLDIGELKHDSNCAYLIAKDLSTNFI